MADLNVGMVGAGFAARFHTESLRRVHGLDVEVIGVISHRSQSAAAFAEQMRIPRVYGAFEEMLADDAVDVVDLCVPTYLHLPMTRQAAQAGKHVIVEKPLTGYCDPDTDQLIGDTVPRRDMMAAVLADCAETEAVLKESGVTFMYAENWVYAPAVAKARQLIEQGNGMICRLRAEESHSGSHAGYAKYWRLAGGGSLLRTGSHPVGGVLHLKQAEGISRNGAPIRPVSVMADVARVTHTQAYQRAESSLTADLADCEDFGSAIITFADGSVAEVCSSDLVLGGVYNYVEVFLSNGRIRCHINPNNMVEAYSPTTDSFGAEYLAEKISTRQGWNFASADEHWVSGYHAEAQDFAEALCHGRPPLSGWQLARDVTAVIFAAYVSAEQGRRIEVP